MHYGAEFLNETVVYEVEEIERSFLQVLFV
jgi:hypothetical protein